MTSEPKLDRETALDGATLVALYTTMFKARCIDDKEIVLKRQNFAYFQISGAGHEAVQVAAGYILRPGYDWFYPYYRDRALCLQLGVNAYHQLLASVASGEDPNSGGRQMPSHWSSRELNIVSRSSATGMQFPEAVGAAEAGYRYSLIKELNDRTSDFKLDEVVYVSSGEGATSEGEFWESLNTACMLKLPVLYLIQDNGYAISVPVEAQTPGGNIATTITGFPNVYIEECDGTDLIASYDALARAVNYCRERRGPAVVRADVVRPYSHSMSDDERLYRTQEERKRQAEKDPIPRLGAYLVDRGHLNTKELKRLEEEIISEVDEAAQRALETSQPPKGSSSRFVFSPDVDPTSGSFDTESEPDLVGGEGTMVDLINRCLHQEMERDPRIVVFGEDVADVSRAEHLARLKGKGGVFKVTANLQRKFGDVRVFNTPIAEATIIGRAMGMATRGLKPVAEIQFFDYIWPAYMQMHNEVSVLRWRSNNVWKCPMVVRVAAGGYLRGGAIYHSQSGVSMFTAIPGWRVVMPATALDANGLLRTAIRSDDPVLFLEHKHLYRQTYNKGPYPGREFMIPFGKAKVVRHGDDVSVITYGALVQRSLAAATQAAENGISVEVIDLRSLNPYDWEAIAASVQKTSRVIIAYEDPLSWGYGAELAARISHDLFDCLDAPVTRVAAQDTFCAYSPEIEEEILPQTADVFKAITELVAY
jgi:2-oxoisovalerate dehydrogenase E1 component